MLELARRCGDYDADFQNLLHECRVLGRYYISTRYPNGVPMGVPAEHFDEQDAQEALQYAERIFETVETKLTELAENETDEAGHE